MCRRDCKTSTLGIQSELYPSYESTAHWMDSMKMCEGILMGHARNLVAKKSVNSVTTDHDICRIC